MPRSRSGSRPVNVSLGKQDSCSAVSGPASERQPAPAPAASGWQEQCTTMQSGAAAPSAPGKGPHLRLMARICSPKPGIMRLHTCGWTGATTSLALTRGPASAVQSAVTALRNGKRLPAETGGGAERGACHHGWTSECPVLGSACEAGTLHRAPRTPRWWAAARQFCMRGAHAGSQSGQPCLYACVLYPRGRGGAGME